MSVALEPPGGQPADSMRAARLHTLDSRLVIEHIPLPRYQAGDVRVRVRACNIMANFYAILANWSEHRAHMPLPVLPAVFGLNAAGVVDRVGSQVQHFRPGDRVYVNPGVGCGSCSMCRHGRDNECADYILIGYSGFGPGSSRLVHCYPGGALAEYMVAPQRNLVRLPANVSFEQAVRFGYLGAAYAALKRAEVGPGSTLVIDGATGKMGLGAVLCALALNVGRILGTGRRQDLLRRVAALAPGRIDTWSLDAGPAGQWIREKTAGVGADVVLNCLGRGTPVQTVTDSLLALRRGGRFVNIGGISGDVPVDFFRLMASHIALFGSNWFVTPCAQEIADLAGIGRLDLAPFEHDSVPLERVNTFLDATAVRRGGFSNVVIVP